MHRVPHNYGQAGRLAIREANAEAARQRRERPDYLTLVPTPAPARKSAERTIELKPLDFGQRSGNELRPATFAEMIGQQRLKTLMARIVANCRTNHRPLDHMMLIGQSGTGKTTLAQVTAHELGAVVFQVKAPVTHAVLAAVQRTCQDGNVLIVDEIHQQVVGDRRGATQAADPEDFYHVMEDRRLPTEGGMLKFPAVTIIGCTTDSGLLPEAFLNRFPLSLHLDPYTVDEMSRLASANARQLYVPMADEAAGMFGLASRRNPRAVNTYVRNSVALGYSAITGAVAREVIVDLNGNTPDGLTPDMQAMLRCLLRSRRENQKGVVVYQASVNTIATALGHSRDTKAVVLFVEPHLIAEGYVLVTHGGRTLTDKGIIRATELSNA